MTRPLNTAVKVTFALCLIVAATSTTASAQSAGSWIDLANGAKAGATADGSLLQFAKSRSSSKNGVNFGHGLAIGANENGISLSNTIGAGTGGAGVAHNLNLHIGANGTHVSHGGVTSHGGNGRVISGGQAGVQNGQVYGGSQSTGFGRRTNAWSNSRTQQWGPQQRVYQQPVYQQPAFQQPAIQNRPMQNFGGQVLRNIRF